MQFIINLLFSCPKLTGATRISESQILLKKKKKEILNKKIKQIRIFNVLKFSRKLK